MKLFTKYNRINLLATILIFLIASAAFYFTLSYVFRNQIDQDLKIEELEIEAYVKEHHSLPENIAVQDQTTNYTLVQQPFTQRYYTTAVAVDPAEKNKENFRQLIFGIAVNNQWYKITVGKSLEDTDDLIHSILLITFITILLILMVSLVINRVVLKRIWKPFYDTLAIVKNFKVSKSQNLGFEKTEIEEFNLMNETIERITSQAQVDYLTLKTFSDNASHEMQTPLAVIRSKLDLMIQDEHLTEQQSQTLQSAYNAIEKLTKLNHSLMLLARIENNQYELVQTINMKNKIREKMMEFQELWQAQNLKVTAAMEDIVWTMNNELSDILLNNLFSNATRHNIKNGSIGIELKHDHFSISNTSWQPLLQPEHLFRRFYKSATQNESNGLGLSIIKQICDVSGLHITYSYHDGLHEFMITR